jgi:hypothetical protein
MNEMWNARTGLLLLLLATGCVPGGQSGAARPGGERPGAVLRRDFPAVAIQRLGAYEHFYIDFGDRAILEALHRSLRAGVPKDSIERVTLTAYYGGIGRIIRAPDGRPDSYDLWLRIAGCERLVYMAANFNGRVVTVSDESGCLQ